MYNWLGFLFINKRGQVNLTNYLTGGGKSPLLEVRFIENHFDFVLYYGSGSGSGSG
ncbi:Uncharacterised protein [Niallia circulans]|nr:Uncharacterised protein [Niallia circulans]